MGGGRYVPSVNHLLFLLNVCTASDNNIFWSCFFWESLQIVKFYYLSEYCGGANNSVLYTTDSSRESRSVLPCISTQHESVIILDRNISYLSELHIRRNLASKVLYHLSQTTKWPWILASATLLLRLMLNESNVCVIYKNNMSVDKVVSGLC